MLIMIKRITKFGLNVVQYKHLSPVFNNSIMQTSTSMVHYIRKCWLFNFMKNWDGMCHNYDAFLNIYLYIYKNISTF